MKTLLETERLYFKNFHPEDCEEMFLLNADWNVLKYTGDAIFHTIAEARKFFEDYQINTYQRYGFGRMTTILKETNEVIGWCGLKYHPEESEVDLGYRFHKRFWNKAYGTEAGLACLWYAYEELNLTEIVAYAMRENIGSCRVLEKCGFEFVGMKEKFEVNWKYYKIDLPIDYNPFLH